MYVVSDKNVKKLESVMCKIIGVIKNDVAVIKIEANKLKTFQLL